ncbi:MAG: dihydroneopterin aldolase [Bacteroidales bacterium]|nr:dihydroneopterin aldolase [Bacteroidales bacterium]
MTKISLNNMQFFAHHGCFEEERIVGTQFSVSLSFDVDTAKAEQSDNLSDTVSYLEVYQLVKTEMRVPSNLLEHVARRILDAISQAFPKISNLEIEIKKLNPPLGGEIENAGITIRAGGIDTSTGSVPSH